MIIRNRHLSSLYSCITTTIISRPRKQRQQQHLLHHCFSTTTTTINNNNINIPIIDLSIQDPYEIGYRLHDACSTVGFFYLIGHGISDTLQEQIIQQSREFFQLSIHEKESISVIKSNSYRGYQKIGVNISKEKLDGHEGLDFISESERANIIRQNGLTNYGTNQWPNAELLPQFQSIILQYIQEMNHVGKRLITAMSCGLGLPTPNYLDEYFTDPYWTMRLLRYPPASNTTNTGKDDGFEYGVGEHTDYGVFTMILCDNVPNTLQIKPKQQQNDDDNDIQKEESTWIIVDPIPGAYICNIGDMLARWTNNIYVSTPHRVLRPTNNIDRISIPFFFDPNYDSIIKPISKLVQQSKQPPCFTPIMYGDHLLAKTSNNFKY